jgi:hypothetical protein
LTARAFSRLLRVITAVQRPLLSDRAPFTVTLWDGTGVTLRPIRPGDEERVRQAYARLLSAESRYNRFWQKSGQMSPELAARLTDTDDTDHVAWFALKPGDEDFPGFGAASFWRQADQPDQAEVAFTIADEWQRCGFATLLFSILWFDGWRTGLKRFVGFSRIGNLPMRAFWKAMGGQEALTPNQVELRFDLMHPEEFLEQAPFEMEPGLHRHEVAVWMQEWLALTRT